LAHSARRPATWAGYRAWQQLGRQVRKGEKAIKILGYSTEKITKTDPDTGEAIEDRLVRYPVLSVFDPLSQTDGDHIRRLGGRRGERGLIRTTRRPPYRGDPEPAPRRGPQSGPQTDAHYRLWRPN
jgi:hypothetical protein